LEMGVRCWITRSPAARRATWQVVEQFVPCVVAGGLITAVLVRCAPESCWMLPGLWAVLFGLGVFSVGRLLPRAIAWVGVFYVAAGIVSLIAGSDGAALSPWAMGAVFGPGQLASAGILYVTIERSAGGRHESA
jgi:hypothetical protein